VLASQPLQVWVSTMGWCSIRNHSQLPALWV
jgi:hypothetical protein